jgi:hypothetical protein
MKKFIAVAAVAATILGGSLTAATAASATPAAPTATRIVIYTGTVNETGNPALNKPTDIFTNDDGILIDSTAVCECVSSAGGAASASGWRYKLRPLSVTMPRFTWSRLLTGGQHAPVLVTNLTSVTGKWAYLGKGTYTPTCLTWDYGKAHEYVGLEEYTARVFTWTKVASAGKCPANGNI